jgi:hypothetical protein
MTVFLPRFFLLSVSVRTKHCVARTVHVRAYVDFRSDNHVHNYRASDYFGLNPYFRGSASFGLE